MPTTDSASFLLPVISARLLVKCGNYNLFIDYTQYIYKLNQQLLNKPVQLLAKTNKTNTNVHNFYLY